MSFRVYRFEVLDEIGREGANTIYEARDTADSSSTVHLYEWTPSPRECSSATESLSRLTSELDGAEAFSSGSRLYVAASSMEQARKALQFLRSHDLFPGVWPGVIEELSCPAEAQVKTLKSITAQIKPSVRAGAQPQVTSADESLKAPGARLWLIAVVVVIAIVVAGIVIANWDSKPEAPVTRVNTDNGLQPPPIDQNGDAKRAVRDAVDSWVQAFRSRDTSALASSYAPSVEIVEKYSGKTSDRIRSRDSIQQELEWAFSRISEIKAYQVDDTKIEMCATAGLWLLFIRSR